MLLSVIIPTKNRQFYCIETIKAILSLNISDYEIVIQDNSDDDSLRYEIDALSSERIIYNFHSGVLSFVDNFSEAVRLATGEFLCMIGDDDSILPNIISVADMMKKNDLDAVIPSLSSIYFWPSNTPIVSNAENGYLLLQGVNHSVINISPIKNLRRLLQNAGQDYQTIGVPRIYHGLVKRSTISEIEKRTGRIFAGLTPDMYLSVALCFVCNKVWQIGYPITVSGICPRSGSADSATGRHTGDLKNAPHFRGHNYYDWKADIPYIYTVETIWAETLLQAIDTFDPQMHSSFNFKKLYAICYAKYPQFRQELSRICKENKVSFIMLKFIKIELFIKKTILKIFNSVKLRIDFKQHKYYNVNSIFKAVKITSDRC